MYICIVIKFKKFTNYKYTWILLFFNYYLQKTTINQSRFNLIVFFFPQFVYDKNLFNHFSVTVSITFALNYWVWNVNTRQYKYVYYTYYLYSSKGQNVIAKRSEIIETTF